MSRITEQQLQCVADRINTVTGNPLESWKQVTESSGRVRNIAQVGNYHLDWAYGGVMLCQMMNAGGGVTTITGRGTKRECYDQMQAFLRGIEATTAALLGALREATTGEVGSFLATRFPLTLRVMRDALAKAEGQP